MAVERIAAWVDGMHPRLAGLQDFLLPEGFPFDFSARSLNELEGVLLDRFENAAEVREDAAGNDTGFAVRVVGYLGESLMRVGGGTWKWDNTDDGPSAQFDRALDIPVVSPLLLLEQAADQRTGRVFAASYELVRRAVAERQQQDPDWSPVKEPTPALDDTGVVSSTAEPLTAWLHNRKARFPAWLFAYVSGDDPAAWDFSTASLDRLEQLVRRRLTSNEDFAEPSNLDFVEGATWYLGEVIIRQRKADWAYIEGEPNPYNEWVGRPFLRRIESPHDSAVPELTLMNCIKTGEAGYLRDSVELFD